MDGISTPLEPKPKLSWLSEGLIIAATPIFAYLFTYFYEIGFAKFFGIPGELINITTIQVLKIMTLFLLLFFVPLIALTFIFPKIPRGEWFARLVIVGLLLNYYPWHENELRSMVFSTLALLFIDSILVTLDKFRRNGGYFTWLVRAYTSPYIDRRGFWLLIFLTVGLIVATSEGLRDARTRDVYLVRATTPETVVLRIYGDTLMTIPGRARAEHHFDFVVYKTNDAPPIAIRTLSTSSGLYAKRLSIDVTWAYLDARAAQSRFVGVSFLDDADPVWEGEPYAILKTHSDHLYFWSQKDDLARFLAA